MKDKLKYLSKNVLLFALNGFLPKVISFVLIPIYTGYLTTAQYGVTDLITTTVQLLVPIFTLDIQDAVMRYALEKDIDNRDVFSNAMRIILLGLVPVVLGTMVVGWLHIPGIESSYLLYLVLMYITTSLQNTISLFCRGIDKVQVVVVSSVLHSGITLSANILFLVVFHWGLNGYLAANTIGSVCALVYSFFGAKLYRYITWKPDARVGRIMRRFSFPLIFSVIAWWVNNASDRYILSWIAGVAVSGVYAVSYKIPSLLSVFQNVFAQAWSISAIKEFDKDDADGFIGKMYTMMNFAMVLICSGLMVVEMPVAKLLYAKGFFEAWKYVPPLLLSVVLNAMALFIGSIFTAVKDTKTLSASTITGAAVNTICNVVFISLWGAYGAALATLIGYAATLAMRHVILRRYIHMRLNWRRDLTGYGLLLVQMGLAAFGWGSIPAQCVCTVLVLWLYRKELGNIVSAAKGFLNKKRG